jgi:hypothetical protein
MRTRGEVRERVAVLVEQREGSPHGPLARVSDGALAALQRADEPDYDGMLERFPQYYHEPYYGSYLGENFSAIARRVGLKHRRDVKAFVSKVMVFDKPLPQ